MNYYYNLNDILLQCCIFYLTLKVEHQFSHIQYYGLFLQFPIPKVVMAYQEYEAPETLKHVIDSFWTIKDLPSVQEHRVVPDGCADIIFNLGTSDCSIPRESIGISGMMTTFRDVTMDDSSELFGIRFRAGQLKNLTSTPLSLAKNLNVTASDIIPSLNETLLDKIANTSGQSDRISIIQDELCKIVSNEKSILEPITIAVITHIENTFGLIDSGTLAHTYCISLRQLERKFKQQVGVTIKEFSRVIRFKKVSQSILDNPHVSMSEMAFQYGYYDHSHLTNEFRKLSGSTPSDTK